MKVDELPLIEPFVKLKHKDYKQLIKENSNKPIKRRKELNINVNCPCCGAPKDYLYNNNSKQTQFECKVCSHIFAHNHSKIHEVVFEISPMLTCFICCASKN